MSPLLIILLILLVLFIIGGFAFNHFIWLAIIVLVVVYLISLFVGRSRL